MSYHRRLYGDATLSRLRGFVYGVLAILTTATYQIWQGTK